LVPKLPKKTETRAEGEIKGYNWTNGKKFKGKERYSKEKRRGRCTNKRNKWKMAEFRAGENQPRRDKWKK